MGSRSQGIRWLREAAREAMPLGVVALVFFGAAGIAWKLLTGPPKRAPAQLMPERKGPGYVIVTGAAVDLEVIAPDGKRVYTEQRADSAGARIAGSGGQVDCAGYGSEHEANATCTASVTVPNPPYGDYRVVVAADDSVRGETLTVGWGGTTFSRAGGFSVRIIVEPKRPKSFRILVAPEGVSQRTSSKLDLP